MCSLSELHLVSGKRVYVLRMISTIQRIGMSTVKVAYVEVLG
jgi:hypothetical protein